MLVLHTRQSPRQGFGAKGTETKVEELPDIDGEGHPTPVPDGAVLAPEGAVPHDWQPVPMAGFPGGKK
jgi:hypothetical protein